MDIEIKMPDLATTDSEVTLLRWWVNIGQNVTLGQPLLEIETDKATMDVESVAAGTLKAIHAQPGERVAVGQVIAVIEGVGTGTNVSKPAPQVTPEQAALETQEAPLLTTLVPKKGSLFARNKAARESSQESLSLSPIQREVARRTLESKQTVPHFYLTTSANAGGMVARREASGKKIAWDAFFVTAAARALRVFERMGYRIDGDKLSRNADAIGVAVDIDDDLYVVPIENPLTLTQAQISDRIRAGVEKIRQGDPSARRLGSTCLTITNLGAENIESFQAIINPPDSAILAIGKIAPTVTIADDHIVVQTRVTLSLSVDHRVVSGKYAAKFLSRIVQEVESF